LIWTSDWYTEYCLKTIPSMRMMVPFEN
jgi:hypothetical protein